MYYDNLKTHRENAGIRISALAKASGIDRTTISRVEKHHKSTKETLVKIVTALNDLHYDARGNSINHDLHITKESKFGSTNQDADSNRSVKLVSV